MESSGCKHAKTLLRQKRPNSSKISMDRLIKVDEKPSVSNLIHVSYIRSSIETCMLCKSSASENFDAIRH